MSEKIIKILKKDSVIITYKDQILAKSGVDKDTMKLVKISEDFLEIRDILFPKIKEKELKKQRAEKLIDFLENNKSEYLTKENASYYINSISTNSVPQLLVEELALAEIDGDEEKITSLLNFWDLASKNPDCRARGDLFWFLKRNGLKTTKSGLFVGYRKVDTTRNSESYDIILQSFIDKIVSKLSKKGKKLKNYYVYKKNKTGKFIYDKKKYKILIGYEYVGNLKKLYEKRKKLVFTDNYTKTFEIRLGRVVEIPRKDCDPNPQKTCSKGLHIAALDWIKNNSFGNVAIRVLVNPADVVAVPTVDNYGKMRVCRYYVDAILNHDSEKNEIVEDITDFNLHDTRIYDEIIQDNIKKNTTDNNNIFKEDNIEEVSGNLDIKIEKIINDLKKLKDD